MVIKTQDGLATKESEYSEACCLLTLCYLKNTSPSKILVLAHYWAGKNILARVDSIHP